MPARGVTRLYAVTGDSVVAVAIAVTATLYALRSIGFEAFIADARSGGGHAEGVGAAKNARARKVGRDFVVAAPEVQHESCDTEAR